ncbi:hypothetical protein LXA43DRAFT_478866 [Ganoderma leucocontextum]|nr:hypothetical protein LXA43DRAFT_478866 [Ganoderma leucocontextum]
MYGGIVPCAEPFMIRRCKAQDEHHILGTQRLREAPHILCRKHVTLGSAVHGANFQPSVSSARNYNPEHQKRCDERLSGMLDWDYESYQRQSALLKVGLIGICPLGHHLPMWRATSPQSNHTDPAARRTSHDHLPLVLTRVNLPFRSPQFDVRVPPALGWPMSDSVPASSPNIEDKLTPRGDRRSSSVTSQVCAPRRVLLTPVGWKDDHPRAADEP